MYPKQAWKKIILHCKWLGIPVEYKKKNRIQTVNGRKIIVEATTNQIVGWEQNFKGAWKIAVYIDKITWEHNSVLLHEIGHVVDYRNNMMMSDRTLIENEKKANTYALKIAKLLYIPTKNITPTLNRIIKTYKDLLKITRSKKKCQYLTHIIDTN